MAHYEEKRKEKIRLIKEVSIKKEFKTDVDYKNGWYGV